MTDLKQFEEWYKAARKDDGKQLEFVWEIMNSPYTEYYYSLIVSKDTSDGFRSKLWSRFDEQQEKGAELLLSKLDNNEDTAYHPDIMFCLGDIADSHKIEKERILAYARKFADAADDRLREKAIIVLGWIGG